MRAVLALLLIATPGFGQSLNLDVGSSASPSGTPPSTYGAAAGQTGQWSLVDSVSGAPIFDLAGGLTPVEVLMDSGGFDDGLHSAPGALGALMNEAFLPSGIGATYRVRNLIPDTYEVYTYSTGFVLNSYFVTVQGVTHEIQGTFSGVLVEGESFVRHTAVVDSSGVLDITMILQDLSSYCALNGLQLVRQGQVGTILCVGDGTHSLPCPCGNTSPVAGRGCATTTGEGMRIFEVGSNSLAADDIVLTADGCPTGNTGLFYVGQTNLYPGQTLFDGIQCAVGPAIRYPGQLQTTGVATETNLVAQAPGGFFVSGVTYLFQYFSRDIAAGPSPCGGGANLSPALRIVFAP